MEERKEYYAFISYKREDEKWAKWLQNKLEHYRFPANMNGRPDLPKNIRPTFRDVTDLTPGLLAEEIDNALRSSKWLIVICSPRSAKSPWVCKEAQTFIDLGRADHIIPFVIEGEPFSKETFAECYPEALLRLTGCRELLAANINEMGRDAAAIKVVARMFELRFDTLWQRWERERKKRMLIAIFGVVIFALSSLGVGVYIARKNLELDKANEELIIAHKNILVERDYANAQKNRAEMATDSLKCLYDSINQQNITIHQQNIQLAEERDNVTHANWKIMENQSRYLSGIIKEIDNNGDNGTAKLIAINTLPRYLDNPNRPFCIEAEYALRYVSDSPKNMILNGHKEYVKSAHFSPNNKTIVTSSYDNTIRIWDMDSGGELFQIKHNIVRTAIYSPAGDCIISAGYDRPDIMIWDSQDGTLLTTLIGHTSPVVNISFSHDGRLMASCSGETIRLWNTLTWEELRRYDIDCSGISFSPCGNYLISIHYRYGMKIYDIHTGEKVKYFFMDSHVSSFAFSPDGKYIILGFEDGDVEIMDFETMRTIHTLKGHADKITSISVNPINNTFATSSEDKCVVIWDLENHTIVKKISTFNSPVGYIEYSPNGYFLLVFTNDILSIEQDKVVKVLDLRESFISPMDWIKDSTNIQPIVTLSPQGENIMANFGDSIIHVFETVTLNHIKSFNVSNCDIRSISYSPNGQYYMYTTRDGDVCVGDCNSGQELKIHKFKLSLPYAYFSPDSDNILLSSFGFDGIYLWEWKNDFIVENEFEDFFRLEPYRYTPQGRCFWTICEGSMIYYGIDEDADTDKWWTPSDVWIEEVSISGDETMLAASVSRSYDICIYDIQSNRMIKELKGHKDKILSLMFHSNKKYLLSCAKDFTIRVWDIEQGCEIRKYEGFKYASFSLNGNRIIGVSTDNKILTWEFMELQQLIDETHKQLGNRQLTDEERRNYYLE